MGTEVLLCCCSVAKSCPILCDLIAVYVQYTRSSTPGFSVLYYLLEFAKIHVHIHCDAILTISSSAALLLLPSIFSQHQGLF